ncbi:hypothetical protein MNV_1850020 [Candidatus Methanoperedens nitroreducens]|uniref:Uncharacterized protein n=1 Tax=Candidatus Methanoperedens nitratireducens TaxID=1392998 RepID=A0A284VMK4_9EURY|nr:hypothetical protein MNV_1850020 [Candidatus Methanoperedens nitroreducens]
MQMKQIHASDFSEGYGEIITAAILWGLAGIFAKRLSGCLSRILFFTGSHWLS